jgi:hypothetical protein
VSSYSGAICYQIRKKEKWLPINLLHMEGGWRHEPNEGKKRFLFSQIVGHEPNEGKKKISFVSNSGTWTQWGKKKISFLSNLVGHEPNEGKKRFLFCQI